MSHKETIKRIQTVLVFNLGPEREGNLPEYCHSFILLDLFAQSTSLFRSERLIYDNNLTFVTRYNIYIYIYIMKCRTNIP